MNDGDKFNWCGGAAREMLLQAVTVPADVANVNFGAVFILNQSSNWEGNTSTTLAPSQHGQRTFTRGTTVKVAEERCRVSTQHFCTLGGPLPTASVQRCRQSGEGRRTTKRCRQQKVQECIAILAMPKMHEMESSVRKLLSRTTNGARGNVAVLRCRRGRITTQHYKLRTIVGEGKWCKRL